MGNPTILPGDLHATKGQIRHKNDFNPPIARSQLAQVALAEFHIPWTVWRVWDALHTNLPGTPATDDLALIGGTFGSASPSLQTEDLKGAGATDKYARCQIWLPPEYDAGQTLQLRFHAGMLTNPADNSALLDVSAYKSDEEAGIGADLIVEAAQDMNSTTLADIDFTITATGLSPGDLLDLRVHMAINDAATGTAVKGIIGAAKLLADIRG